MTGGSRATPAPAPTPPPARALPAPRISLPEPLRDTILEHCQRELPNEACGLISGNAPAARGGGATRWLPARNVHASPYRYELHPDDLVRLTLDIDDSSEVIWAVVHSHVASPAVPSRTDLREWRYPDAIQLVVAMTPEPSIRAWWLENDVPAEVLLARGT